MKVFRSNFFSVLILICGVGLTGCGSAEHGADVLAKVNGRPISRAEVDKYYENQSASSPQKPTGEQAESLRLNILKQLIDQEIMMQRAEKLGRQLQVYEPKGPSGPEIVRLAQEGQYDLIILAVPLEQQAGPRSLPLDERTAYVVHHAHCRVQLALPPQIPQEVVDTTPAPDAR